MKKIAFFLTAILFSLQYVVAQPTQAEIDKMMKDAKAEIEKMKKDPKYKDYAKDLPDLDSVKKIMPKAQTLPSSTKKSSDTAVSSIPPKDSALIRSLPIRTFTKAELISYIHNLNKKLSEILRNSYKTDISSIPVADVMQTGTSIALWLNGQSNESVLTSLKAAELKPDNNTLLNNAGGILTSSGLGVYAIPILQYVSEQQPGNNLILNNLGQAYFAIGDHRKAEQYLLQCISSYQNYPDANLALALINNYKGNKSSAIAYAENSLKGAYSTAAHHLLWKLNPKAKLMDYVRYRYKQPQYFNFHKYPLLAQCMKVDDAPILKPEYDAYKNMVKELKEKYELLAENESKIASKTAKEKTLEAVKKNQLPYRPFGVFAIAIIADLLENEYPDRFKRFAEHQRKYEEEIEMIKSKYAADIKKIDEKWEPLLEAMRTGSSEDMAASAKICKEKNNVGNSYLPRCALLTTDYQIKAIDLYNSYFNDMAYWSFLASIDEHGANVSFYTTAAAFLGILQDINTTTFFYPCTFKKNKGTTKAIEIKQPDCIYPEKVIIPLWHAKIELSCDTYKVEAAQKVGWAGKFEINPTSGDLTLAVGWGASVPKLHFSAGAIKGGTEAEVKSQFYITVNKGHITDGGILWEAEIKARLGIAGVETTTGYEEVLTAGFGSGVQMKEGGPLKGLIDKMYRVQPDDKQVDKRLQLYKK